MTEPQSPADLSHLSEEEFIALCPQGEHAPGVKPLSPAASAYWDEEYEVASPAAIAAAALRAAADQLPLQLLTREPPDQFELGLRQGQELSRIELLAIAAELEGQL